MATTSENNIQPIGALSGRINFDPTAVLDFQIDWSAWLADDTIITSTWTVQSPLTQPFAASNTTMTATVWVTGGGVNTIPTATNHIVTAGGREEDATLFFYIRNVF